MAKRLSQLEAVALQTVKDTGSLQNRAMSFPAGYEAKLIKRGLVVRDGGKLHVTSEGNSALHAFFR